jgi:holo-[acyl-carrier protein] synthase
MKLATGVDLIEIERVEEAVQIYGKRFLERIFTLEELAEAKNRASSLAARFAAKEAVAKALGTGIGAVGWQEIEVLREPSGKPVLHLHGMAYQLASEMNLNNWTISLSHTRNYAIASAVGFGED